MPQPYTTKEKLKDMHKSIVYNLVGDLGFGFGWVENFLDWEEPKIAQHVLRTMRSAGLSAGRLTILLMTEILHDLIYRSRGNHDRIVYFG